MTTHLKPLHRSGGPLGAALASLPAWAEARDRLHALERFPAARPQSIEATTAARIDIALTSDDANGEGLLDDIATLMNRAAAEQLLSSSLVGMKEAAVAAMDEAVAANTDSLLTNLDVQMQDLLAEATEILDEIGQVDDAEAALDAGVLEPFRRMRSLRSAYVELRAAQQRIFTLGESMGRNMRDLTCAFIAAPLAVDPEFIERRLNQKIRVDYPGGRWTMRDPRPAAWPSLHEPEALDWLVRHPDARPWVPTTHQLEEAELVIVRAVREFTDDHRAQLVGKRRR